MAPQPVTQYDPAARFRQALPDETIFEFEEAIADLESTAGWRVLQEILDVGRSALADVMVNTPFPDLPSQARFAGYAAGVQQLTTIVEAIKKEADQRRARLNRSAEAEEAAKITELAPDGLTPAT